MGYSGVADCLKANQVDQVRARCMLLLAIVELCLELDGEPRRILHLAHSELAEMDIQMPTAEFLYGLLQVGGRGHDFLDVLLHLAGMTLLCNCGRPHVKLRGYSREHKMSWTKAAEGYPPRLASFFGLGGCRKFETNCKTQTARSCFLCQSFVKTD